MAKKDKVKRLSVKAFTPDNEYLAIVSPNGMVKIWSTANGDLLAEWSPSDGDPDSNYSCVACSLVGKKRRKERGTCLLALGTLDGSILVINVFTAEKKWTSNRPGGIAGLSFANKGRVLRMVGVNGMVSEMDSETGVPSKDFKTLSKSVSSLAFSQDEKYLAVADGTLQIRSWDNGEEVLKIPNDHGPVHFVSISNDAKAIVTSCHGDKGLQVWWSDFNTRTLNVGPMFSMRHSVSSFQCQSGCSEEADLALLAISSSSAAIAWNLKKSVEHEAKATKIKVKTKQDYTEEQNDKNEKNQTAIISFKLIPSDADGQMKALVAYGSLDHPQFSLLDISNSEENIILNIANGTQTVQGNKVSSAKGLISMTDSRHLELQTEVPSATKKKSKKRAAPDSDLPTTTDKVDSADAEDLILNDDDLNEPTMGEKLASLNLVDEDKATSNKENESSAVSKPPSADSMDILLKQALNADDRALLLNCLHTQDAKVIANSVSKLTPSNVLKLLHSLVSIIQSRGAILASALPWLKYLLLGHASGIMSQESSLLALNSLYQLIESRVSTFEPAIQLSSSLDILYGGVIDEEEDENQTVPFVYKDDDDESDEESDKDAMLTDHGSKDGSRPSDESLEDASDIDE